MRRALRPLRVDRMDAVEVLPERFRDEPGKTLADLLRQVKAEAVEAKKLPARQK